MVANLKLPAMSKKKKIQSSDKYSRALIWNFWMGRKFLMLKILLDDEGNYFPFFFLRKSLAKLCKKEIERSRFLLEIRRNWSDRYGRRPEFHIKLNFSIFIQL